MGSSANAFVALIPNIVPINRTIEGEVKSFYFVTTNVIKYLTRILNSLCNGSASIAESISLILSIIPF